MDLHTLDWSQKMLDEYEIDIKWLPKIIKESSADFGSIQHQ